MTVQIHIDGMDAGEAIRELSVLASHLNLSTVPSLATGGVVAGGPATEAPKTEKPPARNRSTAKDAETVLTARVKKEDIIDKSPEEAEQLSESNSDPIEVDDSPVITVEELRAKAGEVAKSGKQAEVKALLTKFEAASISALPEDKRAEFMQALEDL